MLKYHNELPNYAWNENKGYGTLKHRLAIEKHGITPYHRKTFRLLK
jgi:ribonuclease HII